MLKDEFSYINQTYKTKSLRTDLPKCETTYSCKWLILHTPHGQPVTNPDRSLEIAIGFIYIYIFEMMTSSNWNIFRVTGHLCGEFTGHRRRIIWFHEVCCPYVEWVRASWKWMWTWWCWIQTLYTLWDIVSKYVTVISQGIHGSTTGSSKNRQATWCTNVYHVTAWNKTHKSHIPS